MWAVQPFASALMFRQMAGKVSLMRAYYFHKTPRLDYYKARLVRFLRKDLIPTVVLFVLFAICMILINVHF